MDGWTVGASRSPVTVPDQSRTLVKYSSATRCISVLLTKGWCSEISSTVWAVEAEADEGPAAAAAESAGFEAAPLFRRGSFLARRGSDVAVSCWLGRQKIITLSQIFRQFVLNCSLRLDETKSWNLATRPQKICHS